MIWRAAGRWNFESGVLASTLAAALGGEEQPNPFEPKPPDDRTAAEVERESRRAWAVLDAFMSQVA